MVATRWSGPTLLLLGALVLIASPPLRAEEVLYTLEVPDGLPITYTIDIPVEHPGELIINAEWPGSRVLSFRIDAPAGILRPVRRSGPSPQHLSITLGPDEIRSGQHWTLSVRALAATGSVAGQLSILTPDAAPAEHRPVITVSPEPAPQQKHPQPKLPGGSPPSWKAFAVATNHLRDAIENEPVADACRWQRTYLDYLENMRDELYENGTAPKQTTQRVLLELAEAIRMVDELRLSTDPVLTGPVPQDPQRKRAWVQTRRERFMPIEGVLDAIQQKLRRGHAPELQSEEWPVKLVSCVMACERHFDQRTLHGAENATNFDLAQHQWQRLLSAAGTLEATALLD